MWPRLQQAAAYLYTVNDTLTWPRNQSENDTHAWKSILPALINKYSHVNTNTTNLTILTELIR